MSETQWYAVIPSNAPEDYTRAADALEQTGDYAKALGELEVYKRVWRDERTGWQELSHARLAVRKMLRDFPHATAVGRGLIAENGDVRVRLAALYPTELDDAIPAWRTMPIEAPEPLTVFGTENVGTMIAPRTTREAEAAREEGIETAKRGVSPEWLDAMVEIVRRVAGHHSLFTTDEVWAEASTQGVSREGDPRAIAAVMRRAVKEEICERTNTYRASRRRMAHGGPKRIYSSLIEMESR